MSAGEVRRLRQEPSPDHPNVRIPPPLIYVVMFGLVAIPGELLGLPQLPSALRFAAAVPLSAGLALLATSVAALRRMRTHVDPRKPTTALVTMGPYRLTRNPIYLGLALVYVGAALWTRSLPALVALPLVVLGVDRLVIAAEERYLERKFGDQFVRYRDEVRRWI